MMRYEKYAGEKKEAYRKKEEKPVSLTNKKSKFRSTCISDICITYIL
jgi:hypothetical protein